MFQYGRPSRSSWAKSVRSSIGRTVVGKAIRQNSIGARLGKSSQLVMLIRAPWKGLFLSVYVDDITLAGKKQNVDPMWGKYSTNKLICENQHHSLIMFTWLHSKTMWNKPGFQQELRKNYQALKHSTLLHGLTTWKVMPRNAWNGIVSWQTKTTQQLYKVSTPCPDDNQVEEEELRSVGELSNVCSQIALKCFYFARIGRPDSLWSVNKLARAITKWSRACDKRLASMIFYIHCTIEYKQYCHVGSAALKIRNQPQLEHYAYLEATHVFQ